MRTRLILAAMLALLLVTLLPAVAMAQEEGEGDTEAPAVIDDSGAAVPVPPLEEADDEQPWTSRFLPPTLVLLTVLTIGGLAFYYFFAIRRKYEVVPE